MSIDRLSAAPADAELLAEQRGRCAALTRHHAAGYEQGLDDQWRVCAAWLFWSGAAFGGAVSAALVWLVVPLGALA